MNFHWKIHTKNKFFFLLQSVNEYTPFSNTRICTYKRGTNKMWSCEFELSQVFLKFYTKLGKLLNKFNSKNKKLFGCSKFEVFLFSVSSFFFVSLHFCFVSGIIVAVLYYFCREVMLWVNEVNMYRYIIYMMVCILTITIKQKYS